MESLRLYGLVDSARDPRLFELISNEPERRCLFAGRLSSPLTRAAPYVVALPDDSQLLKHWREEGWGRSWGIFFSSTQSMSTVRAHFRQFLQAQLPNGRLVFFRFYDPRVWRLYIVTCDSDLLSSWFSGIAEFFAETADGSDCIRYRQQNGEIVERTIGSEEKS